MRHHLTMNEEKAAWRMLADPPGRTQGEVRERLVIVDTVRLHTWHGTHLFHKLGDEAKALRRVLAGAVPAPPRPVVAGGWEMRSAPSSFEQYAAAEAAWQRSPARAQLLTRQPASWRLPPRPPKRLPGGETPSVRLDADTEPRVTIQHLPVCNGGAR